MIQKLLFTKNENPKRIAIHRISAFGDAVVAIPAINLIRENYPLAQIDLYSTNCIGIDISNILYHDKIVNNIYTYTRDETKIAWQDIKNNHLQGNWHKR